MPAKTTSTSRDVEAELAFLTRALKAPSLRESIPRLAERAREQSWTFEEFLAACLQREVNARRQQRGSHSATAAQQHGRRRASFSQRADGHSRVAQHCHTRANSHGR